jgi:hypothetical protein
MAHLASGAEWALGQLSGAKAGNMGRFKELDLLHGRSKSCSLQN